MLTIAYKLSSLCFSKLMQVYREGNIENGSVRYPHLSVARQEAAAEQDFYQYLNEVFFCQENSLYAILQDNGEYIAALRMEPYCDGLLLCALETAPEQRSKGYATLLIRQVIQYLAKQGAGTIYSHVSKRNIASLAVHRKCGFSIAADNAVFSDGSVNNRTYTLKRTYKKSESG